MYTVEDCPRIFCGDCAKWKIGADRGESLCPKLDHKKIKFYKPYFKSYDCGQYHTICSEFEPKHPEYADLKDWTNFKDYWQVFEKAWLTACERRGIAVVLNDDFSTLYRIPLETWLYGDLVQDNVLMATVKQYSVRKLVNGCFLSQVVSEAIDGVQLTEDTAEQDK